MFSNLIDKFRPVFYVQIWEQRIRAINLVNGEVFDDKPLLAVYRRHGEKILSALLVRDASGRAESAAVTNPFSHPRTLLADFSAAEKLLQLILQEKLGGNRRQLIRPRLISGICCSAGKEGVRMRVR